MAGPSKTQVDIAGQRLADGMAEGKAVLADPALAPDRKTVDAWRQHHADQLAWVTGAMSRRLAPNTTSALAPIEGSGVVAQRLNRMPQIIKKLTRLNKMELARMQDIGGCRVVLDGLEQVKEVEHRVRSFGSQYWSVRYESDYRKEGKPDTAYRALHLVVLREDRLIEIQIRTLRQHAWAEAVERVTALSDHGVKDGEASSEILEYFRLASDGFWLIDSGKQVSPRHRKRFRAPHPQVATYLNGNSA